MFNISYICNMLQIFYALDSVFDDTVRRQRVANQKY